MVYMLRFKNSSEKNMEGSCTIFCFQLNHHLENIMLKYAIAMTLFLGPLALVGGHPPMPPFIDFSVPEFQIGYSDHRFSPEIGPLQPFNCAPELGPFFLYLREEYNVRTVVETGTFKGSTTLFFGSFFDKVYTIEVQPDFFLESQETLRPFGNVQCHLGNSPTILRHILPPLREERILFYLDAHWYANCPLLAELKTIQKTHRNNCIIVIDDFKVPGRPDIPYDSYNGDDFSFEYIRKHLDKLFDKYTFHYIIPKNVQSRAKLVVIPKKWS